MLLCMALVTANTYAETAKPTVSKSAEVTFTDGLRCLKSADFICAKLELNKLPSQTNLAKVLDGAIAMQEGDADRTLGLLLPLQADTKLPPAAASSLHASLALAYESIGDPLRALMQYDLTAQTLSQIDQIEANQEAIWKLLGSIDKAQLIELRGASDEQNIQGWIDLALAQIANQNLQDWRKLYPDHPATEALLAELTKNQATVSDNSTTTGIGAKIALILPFNDTSFYPTSDAIEQGFSAAKAAAKDSSEFKIYPSSGNKDEINAIYQQALKDGARYVVGPLTRDEVTSLSTASNGELPVPTLTLNQGEQEASLANMYTLNLSAEAEALQIAKMARDSQLQNALIITTDSTVAMRMSKVFYEAWQAEGGKIAAKINIKKNASNDEIQNILANLASHDLIVFACDYDLARSVRPFLSNTTPTYGFSHIYSGLNFDTLDQALLSVRFTDMPWVLNIDNPEFEPYKATAEGLPQGQMQRWFALGADAYQTLALIAKKPKQAVSFYGLTGKISISDQGVITRQLSTGIFSTKGVLLEKAP